jgi:glycerol-1-phosphate dehydrogenase [NAD(P)+]
MTRYDSSEDEALVRNALAAARETRALRIGEGASHATAELFEHLFGSAAAVIVADGDTLAAAGRDVAASFLRCGRPCADPFVFADPGLYAEDRYVEQLSAALAGRPDAVPIAVGSGTINDLTKLVSHRLGRPYLAVATAASMDGYTAFGASITKDGLKQTFDCPAPAGVLADLEVIAAAPAGLNASGYADLAAKITAGADWLVADALGVEPIDEPAWRLVQGRLREWLGDPAGVRRGDPGGVRRLMVGLIMGGFAMQRTQTSRPASGAEHQFSHLWDMQHHTHGGRPPSHGFKVGIGTLASTALYEQLLAQPLDALDVDRCCREWADGAAAEAESRTAFDTPELAECALRETAAKRVDGAELAVQLTRLRQAWPELRDRLARQLIPFADLERMFREAGCPDGPEAIGISRERLRESYRQASLIRRRFTVLDLARRAGVFDACLDRIFSPAGPWPIGAA